MSSAAPSPQPSMPRSSACLYPHSPPSGPPSARPPTPRPDSRAGKTTARSSLPTPLFQATIASRGQLMTCAAPPDRHTRPAELPARNLTRPGSEYPIQTVRISDCTITVVRTVAELEQWFALGDLEPETLILPRKRAGRAGPVRPGRGKRSRN